MPLGKASRERLRLCPPQLQRLFEIVALDIDAGALRPLVKDTTVLCTFRDEWDQNAAFDEGRSKKRWPESGHNKQPPRAVDFAPYPIPWNDREAFALLQGFVRAKAVELGIRLKPMITWDLPHFELADE